MKLSNKFKSTMQADGFKQVLFIDLLDSKKTITPWPQDKRHVWLKDLPRVEEVNIVNFEVLQRIMRATGLSHGTFHHLTDDDLKAIPIEHLQLSSVVKEVTEDHATFPDYLFAKIESTGALTLIAVFHGNGLETPEGATRIEESTHIGAFDIVWLDKAHSYSLKENCNPTTGNQPNSRVA